MSRPMDGTLPLEDQIAAKLSVFVEGIAHHKMTDHNRRALAQELVADLRALMMTEIDGLQTQLTRLQNADGDHTRWSGGT